MRSPRLAVLELRRFGRGKLPRAALAALLLLPLLYGALYLWSFWDPYGRLDRIPVALVNDDKGRASRARSSRRARTSPRAARQRHLRVARGERGRGPPGCRGRHVLPVADHAVRLQPEDRLQLRTGSETGALQVRTNDANNYIVGQISRTVFGEVRTAASTKASRSFLDKIFISFSDIHGATEKAAKGPTNSAVASPGPGRAPRTSPTA